MPEPTPEEIDAKLGIKPFPVTRGLRTAVQLKAQLPKLDSAASTLDKAIRRAEANFRDLYDMDQDADDTRDFVHNLGRDTKRSLR